MTATYEMKDSGVPWLGKVPKGWGLSSLKQHFEITLGKMLASEQNDARATLEHYMCASNLKWSGVDTTTEREMWFTPEEKKSYLLKEGDLLVMEGGSAGTSCLYRGEFAPCYMQNSVNRCRGKKGNLTAFLYYWLFLVYHSGHIDSVCNRATIMHLTKEKLGKLPFLTIPLSEQTAIASYLDDKCGRIDDVVAQAKGTIEEYKQWKASLIFEAVTKGLDKNAEMKDSGVQWIGQVPKGWKVRRIKNHFAIISGNGFPEILQGSSSGDYPVCKASDISQAGHFLSSARNWLAKATAQENRFSIIPAQSVLFAKIGEAMKKNNRTLTLCACCADNNCQGLVPKQMDSYFAYYLLCCIDMNWFDNAGTIPCISNRRLIECPIPYPPLSEQTAIASYLDTKCSAIDGIIAEKESLIAELEAYKKSLIFETVTGKRRVC